MLLPIRGIKIATLNLWTQDFLSAARKWSQDEHQCKASQDFRTAPHPQTEKMKVSGPSLLCFTSQLFVPFCVRSVPYQGLDLTRLTYV